MENVARLSNNERGVLFNETAAQKGVSAAIVEKDFWVCWILKQIFQDTPLSQLLMFKGGTSLSKVFHLIERFSEDIDLILDWRVVTSDDPLAIRSNTRQEKLNKEINKQAAAYIAGDLLTMLSEAVNPVCVCTTDVADACVINIHYPAAFSDEYLRPEIRLEIGPLAAWTPYESYTISCYAVEAFPNVFKEKECSVNAIKAERTFWEKATILHHEAHRPAESVQPVRYSRHYYDMYMMSNSEIKNKALSDLAILDHVVAFKKRFYRRNWAKYELAKPGTFKLVPEGHLLAGLKSDYRAMENMIFGQYPAFGKVIDRIAELEHEINTLGVA